MPEAGGALTQEGDNTCTKIGDPNLKHLVMINPKNAFIGGKVV